jgi:hypothetical protein
MAAGLLVFRFELNSINSILSIVNFLFLIFFDALTYSLSVLSIYILASYAFFKSMLGRLLGFKIDSLIVKDFSIPNLYSQRLNENCDIMLPITSSITHLDIKSEAFALKSMFSLKQALELKVDTELSLQEYKLSVNNEKLSYILNAHDIYSTTSLSNLLYKQEFTYMNTSNYSAKFNKLHLSDLSSAINSQDTYTSLILENSVSSTLSSANATRWLIKMSPLSESLSINNNFATNIKSSLGSSITNSQLSNNNI